MTRLPDKESFVERLLSGDRVTLGRALTLIESRRTADRAYMEDVLDRLMPHTGRSLRIGITGSPGVGKSTFIDSFGSWLIARGHRVGVLAVDPTSKRTGGSILGDKTRMIHLSRASQAFIRPSPAGKSLGGVAARTRESILVLEAAGYDLILIETVGVGQSETAVYDMTDFYLLLILAGAGDELQGIKRGVVELADMIVVNKADGDRIAAARRAQAAYRQALHLFPPKESGWTPPVLTASALEQTGLDAIWQHITDYRRLTTESGYFDTKRRRQLARWMHDAVQTEILDRLFKDTLLSETAQKLETDVTNLKKSPIGAAKQLVSLFLRQNARNGSGL